jgi:hypothetical protein
VPRPCGQKDVLGEAKMYGCAGCTHALTLSVRASSVKGFQQRNPVGPKISIGIEKNSLYMRPVYTENRPMRSTQYL